MPDPNWTQSYNYANSPENNGFTRVLTNSPVISEISSGPPADRRLEIDSNNGAAVFLTSQVPTLDPQIGITAEYRARVSGTGNAGIEATFLNAAVLLMLYADRLELSIPTDRPDNSDRILVSVSGLNNTVDTVIRLTFSAARAVTIYRNGTALTGPWTAPTLNKPSQRLLFWGEAGGTQVFTLMRWYQGGPVAPG